MRDLFLIIDEAGNIECAGPVAAEVFGYALPELLGQPAQRFLEVPDQRSVFTPPFLWLNATPNPILLGIHRDGRRFPLRLTQHEIQGATQEHVVLLLQDPARAPAAQDVFLQHKELYELATVQGRISVWEIDYRTNHLEFSPVLAQMLGLSEEQIPTSVEGWSRQFHPDDWQALERESTRMLRREIPELNVECRMRHANGQMLWTLVRGHASFDDAGQPIRMVGTSIDITERKKAEQERDLFFEMSLDPLCIADTHGYFRRVNPQFSATLGYSAEELTARPFFDFIHPDDLEATRRASADLAEGKPVVAFENRYFHKDGSIRWLSWRVPAARPGEDVLYAIARDVTEARAVKSELERAKQEAERANRAKSEFLSRMSHELRTPLNAILGFSQLLLRDPLNERQRKQIDLIGKGGRHLLTLINEVLDITRIEVGRLDLSPESLELAELLHEVVNLTHPLAEQHGVRIEIDEPSTAEARVLADKQRLKQVLLNLVANAIKYNVPQGSVRIFCEPAPPALRTHVQDTGVGIARDKQDRLFTPFDRLGAEMSSIEGSGLGLVLSKRLVEVMGGVLTFASGPGRGSTFTIELAQGKAAQTLLDVLPVALTPTPIDIGPARTVLYIEDNHANVELIDAILGLRPGIRLASSREGEEGLAEARRLKPDLILLDVHLPDMKGSALLAVIRAEPALRDIPVIVVSADATAAQIERLLAAGASEYLTKPIDVDHFLHVLDRHLGSRPV